MCERDNPSGAELVFCYVPVHDPQTGQKLVEAALSLKLAACGNLLGPMTSYYEWQGEAKAEQEWLLILKSTRFHQSSLMALIEELHPYTCPCISCFPVTANAVFTEWVQGQTTS